MQSKLQKVINFAKKTGDRIIAFDQENSDNSFVVMGFEEYERIVSNHSVRDLTENELLDRINRDIAIWKGENDELNRTHEEILGKRFNNSNVVNSFDSKDNIEEDLRDDFFDGYNEDDDLLYYENVDDNGEEQVLKTADIDFKNEDSKELDNEDSEGLDTDDDDFSSLEDSINKRRKGWNIPADVKDRAIE